MQQQAAAPTQSAPPQDATTGDAPPKQVAQALERLGQAGRLIADVRLGADRLLEALFFVEDEPNHQHTSKCVNLIAREGSLMRHHLDDLRSIGRQLEESGVLTDSLRSRSNSWGLHMPLVCPDGAVVAYAWKRQLAGQAGASAVDRTRLALKAFTDQKKRFFLHLADDSVVESAKKKHCSPRAMNSQEEIGDQRTVADILSGLEKEVPNLQTFTHQRLDWLKQATSLTFAANESSLKNPSFPSTSKLRQGSVSISTGDKAAVIELLLPCVFRAVVSLHTAGSMDPDAVAFFSPDEEHASMALQYFISSSPETALHCLLHWVCSYQSLFTKVCSKLIIEVSNYFYETYVAIQQSEKALNMFLVPAIAFMDQSFVFDVHPFLMFFGFIFLVGEAMMVYKTVRAERKVQKFVHMFIHLLALCLGIVGLHSAFKFHEKSHIPNLLTLHSWIGIGTFSLFCLQWLLGLSLFLFGGSSIETRARAAPWHVVGGRALFFMAICAALTGLMQRATFLQPVMNKYESRLINFLGLAILLFGVTVELSISLARYI
ncbi:hypothetical protein RD792_011318 [Penstemon davidsonii]|uniref:Cytochrome b561 domain-containing protein n=1 Tax=Penstemon davidsonii TaxID=160366 RepID=A0ABR0D486_9LAMI|nr:hypothetical protein RD792_011318 [Penstemon davidsonii]